MRLSNLASIARPEAFDEIIGSNLVRSIRKLSRGFFPSGVDRLEKAPSDWLASHVRQVDRAARELQDAISLLRTTDAGLTKIQSLLVRARELALEDGELGTMTDQAERAASANTFSALAASIGSVERLLNEEAGVLRLHNMDDAAGAIESLGGAEAQGRRLERIDAAIGAVSANRAHLNAHISGLAAQVSRLAAGAVNASAAASRITDVSVARGVLDTAKYGILSRAKVSLSGQANQKQRNVIGLMG